MNEFVDEYKKCLKRRNKVILYNQKVKKKVRTTHTLFALFFFCVGYFYLKPQYVEGIRGHLLEEQIQAEYTHLVANGWTDITEIQSYLQEYRENKQTSYLMLGHSIYRTREIPELVLHSKWGVIVKPAFDACTMVFALAERTYGSFASLCILLKDSGNGVVRIQQLGDVAASGIWVYFLHLLYWAILWFRRTCSISNATEIAEKDDMMNRWVLVRDGENTRVILFCDMVDIINHPLKRIEPPVVYAWIYKRIGIE